MSEKLKFGALSRRRRLFFVGMSAFIGLDFYLSSIGW